MFTQAKSFQMSLCERFAQESSIKSVNISSLEEKPYSVIGAERMQTKYGIFILLTIKMSSTDIVRLFLPKLFTLIFSDMDIYIYIYIYTRLIME